MIGSTVNVTVFFFLPYLCISESLRLTISWTTSARKYVISSVIHIKQHTVQNPNQKTETVVNLVKPKRNCKLQFFCKLEPKTETKSFFANWQQSDSNKMLVNVTHSTSPETERQSCRLGQQVGVQTHGKDELDRVMQRHDDQTQCDVAAWWHSGLCEMSCEWN